MNSPSGERHADFADRLSPADVKRPSSSFKINLQRILMSTAIIAFGVIMFGFNPMQDDVKRFGAFTPGLVLQQLFSIALFFSAFGCLVRGFLGFITTFVYSLIVEAMLLFALMLYLTANQ